MCGRFTLSSPPSVLARLFLLDQEPQQLAPRFNIAPTQKVAAVRGSEEPGHRRLDLLQWGLIPSWSKDPKIGSRMINARAETVAERPAFRAAFRRRRCLIAADGFYEWVRRGPRKQPYHIRMRDGSPFGFAGLWERWQGPEGDPIESCTVLTTTPNELLKPLHDRMPVILAPGDHAAWLDPDQHEPGPLRPLLRPFDPAAMEAYPVSLRVNNPGNDDPRCIEPLETA
jgi:putative SOS response-associated peptidase YedK